MGTMPLPERARRDTPRATALDGTASATSRTGKARRTTSLDRPRSRRQAVAAADAHVPSASPSTTTHPRHPLVGDTFHRHPANGVSPRRCDIPATAADDRCAHASNGERAVSGFESPAVHTYRPLTAARTQAGRRAQPSTITRRALQRAVSCITTAAFETSNATRDIPESGTQCQKSDRAEP